MLYWAKSYGNWQDTVFLGYIVVGNTHMYPECSELGLEVLDLMGSSQVHVRGDAHMGPWCVGKANFSSSASCQMPLACQCCVHFLCCLRCQAVTEKACVSPRNTINAWPREA